MTGSLAFKAFQPSGVEIAPDGTGRFVVATLNVIDRDGDYTVPGFFGRQTVLMVPAHNWQHVPLGKGVVYERGNEVLVDFKFNLSIEPARQWFEAIRFDLEHPPAVQEYSYGFIVKPGGESRAKRGGREVRVLQPAGGGAGADVLEVSPVLRGAGINTRTVSLTGIQGGQSRDAIDEAAVTEWLRWVEQEANRTAVAATPPRRRQSAVSDIEEARSIARRNGIRVS